MRPRYGQMYWWRFKTGGEWHFGYCSQINDQSMVRMGRWNGDTTGGAVVSVSEIEWKDYS